MSDALSSEAQGTLWEDAEFVLRRRATTAAGEPPLVLAPSSARPPQAVIERLERAFALRAELDSAWSVRPMALVNDGGRPALLLESPGGELLARHVGTAWPIAEFLRVALGLARAVRRLHERGLVHRDIKPSNLFFDPAAGKVWLSGFGIASRLPRERQASGPPQEISGTLAYMSPEQTGRLNRSVDARSDLYSVGVTLYQLLSGSLPFVAATPLEWIHCHVARSPAPLPASIPEGIGAIVRKLLAKIADDRYQTARGLEADLKRSADAWNERGAVAPFPLGEHDESDRLLIPERIYGREAEVERLVRCFERVADTGRAELVLVSGPSGVGKSSLVDELKKAVASSHALFASGKFDQYKRNIPYATIAEALAQLVRHVLHQNDQEVARQRVALQEAVGGNGQLVVDLVPELEVVLGRQPAVPQVSVEDAKNRFLRVIERVLAVFATRQQPLVLFLDDLQWLDSATLELVTYLLEHSDVSHLLLIGAFRDNEVDAASLLAKTLEDLRKVGAPVQEIALAPLSVEHVGVLLSDMLRASTKDVAELAALVHDKTLGNPFFTSHFVVALADDGLVSFDPARALWHWDLGAIRARGFTDNVVELMVGKLSRLPAPTRVALTTLACLGHGASVATLLLVSGKTEVEMAAALWDAVQAGLVIASPHGYEFLHDRVQEAAYSFLPDEQRAATHHRIGKLLAGAFTTVKREEAIFEIVGHYARASSLIVSPEERREVAELNLVAARRARGATAYAAALQCLTTAVALLPPTAWDDDYPLMFDIELKRAECEILTGERAAPEARLREAARRARGNVDLARAVRLVATLHVTSNAFERAIEPALDYCRKVGLDCSYQPDERTIADEYAQLLEALRSRPLDSLADLKLATDAEWLALMGVLESILPAAVFTNKNLFDWTVLKMVNLSLQNGNAVESSMAFAHLAMVLPPRFGDREAAFRFGQIAFQMVEQLGLERYRARVFNVLGYHVLPWTTRLADAQAMMRRAKEVALADGDLTFVGFSDVHLVSLGLAAGDGLEGVQKVCEAGLAFARKANFKLAVDCLQTQLALILALRGIEPFPDAEEETLGASVAIAACWHWIRRTHERAVAGDDAGALIFARKAEPLLWTSPTFFELAEFTFYAGLAEASAGEVTRALAHHARLALWTETFRETFCGRASLVAAEIARRDERFGDAQRLYEQAIAEARTAGLIHDEALANERAARCYADRGLDTAAQAFRANARYCYERWGALAKVRQLDQRRRAEEAVATTTIGSRLGELDLASVIAMSLTVSSEIVLDRVIERLMTIAVEHAGAGRALLILPGPEGPQIEADAIAAATVIVRVRRAPVAPTVLPESILRYVTRTHDDVIIDDASAPNRFASDAYLRDTGVRSVLCLPLVKQKQLVGVLYLENALTSHAFAPDRIEVLRLLVSQAAISLENARLYTDLRRAELNLSEAQRLSGTGSFRWVVQTGEIELSDEACRIFGYEPKTRPSLESYYDRIHPEDRESMRRHVEKLIEDRQEWQIERRLLLPDGTLKHVRIMAHSSKVEDGTTTELIGAVMDVTATKRAEQAEALALANERLELAMRGSRVGIFDFDVRGGSMHEAPLYQVNIWESLGYSPEPSNAAGDGSRYHPDRWHPDDRSHVFETMDAIVRGEADDFDMESRLYHRDGSVWWRINRGVAVRDDAGKVVRIIGTSVDISDRKELEEELRRSVATAEAANRAKDDFLANVSHEIRTPMNAILGMTELVLDTALSDDQRQWLGTAKSAADSLLAIIDELLDFSKIQAGKVELVLGDFSLRAELRDTLHALALRAQKKGLELIVDIDDQVPDALVGDAGRLRQILINLVANAIKFTAQGEVVVRVSAAEAQEPEHISLRVAVEDTGIGIPPEKHALIFEAFAQEDMSTTRNYGGTGLGLTIAARFAALMEGKITLASEPGRGSTFTLIAPFRRRSGVPAASSSPLPRGTRVLVVDDNATFRSVLSRWLAAFGLEVTSAADGGEALSLMRAAVAQAKPYAVAVLDGGVLAEGRSLAARMRLDPNLAQTRIVLMTSGERSRRLGQSYEPHDAKLPKPIDRERLRETIGALLTLREQDHASSAANTPSSSPWPRREHTPSLRVLVAEDNEFNATLLYELLRKRGHEVHLAQNGNEALDLLETERFDLMLLDLHMPGADGFEVIGRVRARERGTGRHLPVIASTARSRREDRERCLNAGMDDFLSKPISSEALWTTVDRLTQRTAAGEPSSSVLDARVLLAACGEDAAILTGLCRALREKLPKDLAGARAQLEAGDTKALRETAHRLLGAVSAASSSAGALASELEDRAEQDRLDLAARTLSELDTLVARVVAELQSVTIERLRLAVAHDG